MTPVPDFSDLEPYVDPPVGPVIGVFWHIEGDVVSEVKIIRNEGLGGGLLRPVDPPHLTLGLRDAAGAVVDMAWACWTGMPVFIPGGAKNPTTPQSAADTGPFHWTKIAHDFYAEVSAREDGGTLEILRGDQRLWQYTAPAFAPRIEDVQCVFEGTTIRVSWAAALAPGGHNEVTVRFRCVDSSCTAVTGRARLSRKGSDGPSGSDPSHGELVFDESQVLPGPLALHVEIDDGFHVTVSEPVRVVVPERPIRLSLDGPMQLPCGQIQCEAWPHFRPCHLVAGERVYRWLIDGVERGDGTRLVIDPLPPGRHLVEVRFAVGILTASAMLELLEPGEAAG